MAGKLTLTIGLPGSGKTTWAKGVRYIEPDSTVLVSRDHLREMMYGVQGIGTSEQENKVTVVQEAIVERNLSSGKHVIVHDMNLRKKYRRRWAEIAAQLDAAFVYQDFTSVSPLECMDNVELRVLHGGRHVPSNVIDELHRKFVRGQSVESPLTLVCEVAQSKPKAKLYTPDTSKPKAIMVDIDGTVALHEGIRNPYDTSRYHLDNPNRPVIDVVHDYAYGMGFQIVFCSGRDERFKDVTYEWLMEHVKVPVAGLFMRPLNDTRRDDIVKLELFDQHIRNNFNVKFVLDDRNRVVAAWRSIGLTVLQVADGDF